MRLDRARLSGKVHKRLRERLDYPLQPIDAALKSRSLGFHVASSSLSPRSRLSGCRRRVVPRSVRAWRKFRPRIGRLPEHMFVG